MTETMVPVKRAKGGSKETLSNYQILAAGTLEELVTKVRQSLIDGWQPLGGPFKVGTDWGVAQAMVK